MSKPWLEIITKARARGRFTEKECKLANKWPTCACRELDEAIPRTVAGMPLDLELYCLGSDFSCAVHDNDFARAESLITAITARAVVVLAQLGTRLDAALQCNQTLSCPANSGQSPAVSTGYIRVV